MGLEVGVVWDRSGEGQGGESQVGFRGRMRVGKSVVDEDEDEMPRSRKWGVRSGVEGSDWCEVGEEEEEEEEGNMTMPKS